MTALWIAVGLLGALLIVGMAGMFLLLAMGRLHLDLGWGRDVHELGPIEIRIDAPRDLVFELISGPYLGRTPGHSGIEVLARGPEIAVAVHHTKVHFYEARTVEVVEFEAPSRVDFRHLTGPVPHAIERFELEEVAGHTTLRYGGEVGIDFFLLGRLAGRHWVRPQWERAVSAHLEDVKHRAERRARLESEHQQSPSAGRASP
jgi:hypothetical protein